MKIIGSILAGTAAAALILAVSSMVVLGEYATPNDTWTTAADITLPGGTTTVRTSSPTAPSILPVTPVRALKTP